MQEFADDKAPALYTVSQAAKYLSLSEVQVQRLCRTGKIPAVKVGCVWRISRSRLLKQLGVEEA